MPEPSSLEHVSEKIDALVRDRMESAPVPGVAVAITRGDEVTLFKSFGYSNIERNEQVNPQTLSRVASITKTFTATAIMRLRDASLLSLDDPLVLHLPEFAVADALQGSLEEVTIRRMLTHHSGLSTEHPDLDWDKPEFPDMAHVLDTIDRVQTVIPQDSAWKYSNLAFSLLGEVVARLSGVPYVDYVLSEIIKPLGLQNTAFDLSPEQMALKAEGYNPPLPGEEGWRIAPYVSLNGFSSAGQLHSNVEDLAKWMAFQVGSTSAPEILSPQSLAEMHRPVYVEADWSSGQCLGWRAVRRGERVYINHGGGVHGFASNICFNVPAKTGAIVLANTWPALWPYELAYEIAEIAIDTLDPFESEPVTPPKPNVGDATSLDEYTGRYFAVPGVYVTVVKSDGALKLTRPEAGDYTLHAPADLGDLVSEDAFRVVNGRGAGEVAEFGRDDSGSVTTFRLGGFKYFRAG